MAAIRRTALCVLAAAGTFASLVGCVPQDRYDNLLTSYRSVQEQVVACEDEKGTMLADIDELQAALQARDRALTAIQQRNQGLENAIAEMSSTNDEYLKRIAQLEIGPLPVEVEDALMKLAQQHPDLLRFDAKRGMVRFASDFTFDLGSAELQSEAKSTIAKLAGILNDPIASNLEVQIVGHTDNVPIGRPETRQKHPTNLHLSVHRAISVRGALANAGVTEARLQVAGYGPYRPAVPNGPRGAAENRRVEIYLRPMPELDLRLVDDRESTRQAPMATEERTVEPSRNPTPEPMK